MSPEPCITYNLWIRILCDSSSIHHVFELAEESLSFCVTLCVGTYNSIIAAELTLV